MEGQKSLKRKESYALISRVFDAVVMALFSPMRTDSIRDTVLSLVLIAAPVAGEPILEPIFEVLRIIIDLFSSTVGNGSCYVLLSKYYILFLTFTTRRRHRIVSYGSQRWACDFLLLRAYNIAASLVQRRYHRIRRDRIGRLSAFR